MAPPVTNDAAHLVPRQPDGGRVLQFDFPGLEVGVAWDAVLACYDE